MKGRNTSRNFVSSKIYIILVLCILFSSIGFFPGAVMADNVAAQAGTGEGTVDSGMLFDLSAIKANSLILTEVDRGQVLLSSNSDEKLHISAACKLMTILIALENGDMNSNVTISKESVEAEGSALSLVVGEKYTLEDLLYAIMLTSANDAAKAVAEFISGDSAGFVSKMNETAARLKMNDTHFSNPTGLYDEEQFTTASDISIMIKYALSNSSFKRLFSARARPWTHQDNTTTILTSPNKLFWSYSGIDGGKIGYNKKEQQSLITSATRDGMTLICIVLDSPEESLFTDASSLLDIGFGEFRKSILVNTNDRLDTIDIDGNEIDLIALEEVYYIHPDGESYIKDLNISTDANLPIKKTKIAGTATYTLTDGTTIDIALYPESEILPAEDFLTSARKKVMENQDILYLIYFLIIMEVFLILAKIINFIIRKVKKI